MQATTINEVLERLNAIISESERTDSRAGFFAALYYKVTYSVQQGILTNQFEDGARMEQLDVTFANRYLAAYDQWKAGQPMSGSWKVAFDTVAKRQPLVLQHLFLGMNAHINLDLGIAAVETMQGKDFAALSNDFNNINSVISSLTNQVIRELDRVSPLLSLLGFHATRNNSILIQFSIDSARDGAWRFAEELSTKAGANLDGCIAQRDGDMTQLGRTLVNVSPLLRFTIWFIHLWEWKRASRIIRAMHEAKKRYLKVAEME
jgi:hypothetical protein